MTLKKTTQEEEEEGLFFFLNVGTDMKGESDEEGGLVFKELEVSQTYHSFS